MKQTSIFLVACFCFGFLQAQSLQLKNVASNSSYLTTDLSVEAGAKVVNTSAQPVTVMVSRMDNNLNPGQESQFCWGTTCYGVNVDNSISGIALQPGDSTTTFKLIFLPNGIGGTSTVSIRFYNRDTQSDHVETTFTFSGVSSLEDNLGTAAFSVFPNPANQFVQVRLNQPMRNASARLLQLDGKVIGTVDLSENSVSGFETAQLATGMYFVQLLTGDSVTATRKVVVTH